MEVGLAHRDGVREPPVLGHNHTRSAAHHPCSGSIYPRFCPTSGIGGQPSNRTDANETLPRTRGKRGWLSQDELQQVIDEAEDTEQETAFKLAGRVGLRRNEVTGVNYQDLVIDEKGETSTYASGRKSPSTTTTANRPSPAPWPTRSKRCKTSAATASTTPSSRTPTRPSTGG